MPPPPRPRPRLWQAIVVIIAGLAVIAFSTFMSLIFILRDADKPDTGASTQVFVVGTAIGGVIVVAGVALMVVAALRRGPRRPPP
ncbi:MAG: hypothetical protein ACM30G_15185 [Micromonosporaceae bacterium]